MRWKLLLIVSTLATLVSAGASLGLSYGLLGTTERIRTPDAAALAILAVPVAAITAASIFVYRHTARRRPLQAALTALLAATLTLAAIIAGSLLLPQPQKDAPAPAPPPNISIRMLKTSTA